MKQACISRTVEVQVVSLENGEQRQPEQSYPIMPPEHEDSATQERVTFEATTTTANPTTIGTAPSPPTSTTAHKNSTASVPLSGTGSVPIPPTQTATLSCPPAFPPSPPEIQEMPSFLGLILSSEEVSRHLSQRELQRDLFAGKDFLHDDLPSSLPFSPFTLSTLVNSLIYATSLPSHTCRI